MQAPDPGRLSAALWVASEFASMMPSASATATTDTFQTTYAGLQAKFAAMVGEVDEALASQSQDVRQDAGLLQLVADLRSRGTWEMDTIGMASAANQAFAIWVYQALMPTVYDRYTVSDCYPNSIYQCTGPAAGPGVVLRNDLDGFITIGPRYDYWGNVPCKVADSPVCNYTTASSDVMSHVWGQVSDGCTYVPGSARIAWKFTCSAGVDTRSSLSANSWGFNSHCGNFPVNDPHYGCVFAAPLGSQQPIALGKSRIGRRGAVPARADVPARTTIPRRARLAGATVRLDRLLFEPMGRGELARPHRGRPGRALKLRRRAGGGFVAQAANRRGARVLLRRAGRRGRVAITLQLRGSQLRAPHACHALPAAISLQRPRVELRSRLRISAGKTRRLGAVRPRLALRA